MNLENPHDKFVKEVFSDVTVMKDYLYHYLSDELLKRVASCKLKLAQVFF